MRETFEVGDKVVVNKVPKGCCGVLKFGWKGVVASVIVLANTDTGEENTIIILTDDTLLWDYECEKI